MSENVIPERALLRLNVRTFKDQVRTRALAAIRRILDAEAAASGAPRPPEYAVLSEFPMTRNDEAATRKVVAALERQFGPDRVHEIEPATASEDFGLFGAAWNVPSVFWVVGGIDPGWYRAAEKAGTLDEIPANHAPDFAPVIHPTLRTGVEAMLAAAGVWLASEEGNESAGVTRSP
jgi:metal-dependent amidase/aminoacylase/carboxypeptidase family protein